MVTFPGFYPNLQFQLPLESPRMECPQAPLSKELVDSFRNSADVLLKELEKMPYVSRERILHPNFGRHPTPVSTPDDQISDQKPIALVVYAEYDWNGAFKNIERRAESLKQHGYDVIYVKCATETEMYNAIRNVGQKQKIATLLVAVHGSPEVMRFGGGTERGRGPCDRNEAYCFDQSDANELHHYAQYLRSDASIVLYSCSTGSGGEENLSNVANSFGRAFPGRKVFAPEKSSYGCEIVFDADNQIVDVKYPDKKRGTRVATYKVPTPEEARTASLYYYLQGVNPEEIWWHRKLDENPGMSLFI